MTELDIAKDNLKTMQDWHNKNTVWTCEKHKHSCERFLEFLEEQREMPLFKKVNIASPIAPFVLKLNDKIQDLKNTIKEYSDNGI